jgi:virulence surface antigen
MAVTEDWPTTNNTFRTPDLAHPGRLNAQPQGTCMSMSTHWLKMCLKFNRKLNGAKEMPHGIATSAMHVKKSSDIDKDPSGSRESWHQSFFEPLSLKGVLKYNGTNTGTANITSRYGGYLISIYGSGGGHTMAFWRNSNFSAFFDPNAGQYSCRKSIFSSFKKDVSAWLTGTYPTLNQDWYVYKITAG